MSEELKKEWQEQYFEILQSCRQKFLESNGLGGISPIYKVTAFDPLLSFINLLLAKQQAIMIEELDNLWVNNHETSEKFELAFGKYLDNKLEK